MIDTKHKYFFCYCSGTPSLDYFLGNASQLCQMYHRERCQPAGGRPTATQNLVQQFSATYVLIYGSPIQHSVHLGILKIVRRCQKFSGRLQYKHSPSSCLSLSLKDCTECTRGGEAIWQVPKSYRILSPLQTGKVEKLWLSGEIHGFLHMYVCKAPPSCS